MRPLDISLEDDTLLVDVYRRPGLTSAQGQAIVERAQSHRPPYANGQLIVLWKAYTAWFDTPVQLLADYEDLWDEGEERMICSELVAWAYRDAVGPLRVTPWPDVAGHGLLTTERRWMDYTTPNMLAHSPDLAFQFNLWPVP